jgi:CRISPR-associated protein Csm4
MTTCAYHLHFDSPLHIGVESIGQEQVETTLGSDTLWGALAQCWSLLYDESIDSLAESSPFVLSSAFPFKRETRYYPVPVNFVDGLVGDSTTKDFKSLKKISYLAENLALDLYAGKPLQNQQLQTLGSHYPDSIEPQPGKKRKLNFWALEQRPRLRIDRQSGGSEEGGFFYCSDQHFEPDCGLFFLARMSDAVRPRFEAALRLLGDQGVGADRSIGRGRFHFSRHEVANLPAPQDSGKQLLLSVCSPSATDLGSGLLQKSLVKLQVRRGHAAAPAVAGLRRPDLLALAEGSVLAGPLQGQIATIIRAGEKVAHPVYRNGLAFCLPIVSREVTR